MPTQRQTMATADKDKKVKQPSAKKRDIQSKKRNLRNRSYKSRVRTAIRNFEEAISLENAPSELSVAHSLIDKGVKKGIIQKNKAARMKSRLAARLK